MSSGVIKYMENRNNKSNKNTKKLNFLSKNFFLIHRESKLTRLLQDALGGRTKTSIIATVSGKI